jgi:hypothetical protein
LKKLNSKAKAAVLSGRILISTTKLFHDLSRSLGQGKSPVFNTNTSAEKIY